MSNIVYYYKYCGLPICRENASTPVYSMNKDLLLDMTRMRKWFPNIDLTKLEITSMNKDLFFKTVWPK